MKQRNYLGALFIGILLVGCKQSGETTSVEPVKVKTQTMQSVVITGAQGFSGTIEETTGTILSFPVGGLVGKMSMAIGQRVNKGALLATVDEAAFQSAYDAAAAMLSQAEDAYQRMKQLHDNGSLPEIQWVDAQSKLKQAAASEQIAKKGLKDCRLYAPFSGVIAEKNVETGQNVLPGMPVAKLVTIQQVKVKVSVPENEITQLQIGQTAQIEVPALGNKTFEGRIVEKGVAAHALSRSYEVKALVDNPAQELMPGMICRMHINKVAGEQKALILPVRVVQLDENNRSFVWVNAGGKAEKRWVRAGELTRQGVVIESGLAVGDEVIVEGQQKVSEQTQISTEK